MLLLADCANKFSDQKKFQKLHIILVIAKFPALGFFLLLKMFEKTVWPDKLKWGEDWLCAAAAYQLTIGICAGRDFG